MEFWCCKCTNILLLQHCEGRLRCGEWMVLTFEPGPCLVMFSSCDLCHGCQGYTQGNSQHHRNSFSQREPHFYDAVVVGICDVYLQISENINYVWHGKSKGFLCTSQFHFIQGKSKTFICTHLQNGSSTLEMTLNLVPAYSFTAIQLSSIWPCREQQLMAGCWLGAQLISRPGPGVMILNSYILLLQSCALCWLHCNGHQIMYYTPPAGFGFIMSSVCF